MFLSPPAVRAARNLNLGSYPKCKGPGGLHGPMRNLGRGIYSCAVCSETIDMGGPVDVPPAPPMQQLPKTLRRVIDTDGQAGEPAPTRPRRRLIAAGLVLAALVFGWSWTGTASPGVVTGHLGNHIIGVRRDSGGVRWIHVSPASIADCAVGERWPECRL